MPECKSCTRTFSTANALRQHSEAVHNFSVVKCQFCMKTFRSVKAQEDHTIAVHIPINRPFLANPFLANPFLAEPADAVSRRANKCEYCDMVFRSTKALNKHRDTVDCTPAECNYCEQNFKTDEALEAHEKNRHPLEPELFKGLPFKGAVGYWVHRDEFKGHKGFGMFQCSGCSRYWSSAHAYQQKYRQSCKRCEIAVQPSIMWVFTEEADGVESEGEGRDDAPHDAARCEACRAGVCRAVY
jgi:hypothetical protein